MFMTLSEYLMESGMKVMLHMAVDPQFAVCSSTNVVSLCKQGHNCCAPERCSAKQKHPRLCQRPPCAQVLLPCGPNAVGR